MSTEPYLSEIQLFSFGFPPKGWAFCNGQILSINQNQALFSLLGTTYGGNGQTTFALPDLRGRSPMHASASHFLGEAGGAETETVTTSQMPAHTHAINVSELTLTARARNAAANQRTPVAAVPAVAAGPDLVYSQAAADANMSSAGVVISGTAIAGNAGGDQAHENRQPALALNYCIAIVGTFPSQNP